MTSVNRDSIVYLHSAQGVFSIGRAIMKMKIWILVILLVGCREPDTTVLIDPPMRHESLSIAETAMYDSELQLPPCMRDRRDNCVWHWRINDHIPHR